MNKLAVKKIIVEIDRLNMDLQLYTKSYRNKLLPEKKYKTVLEVVLKKQLKLHKQLKQTMAGE